MAYIKIATLEYPRHEGDIRLEHPEILESQTGATFPCPPTYAKVVETFPPTAPSGFKLAQGTPVLNGIQWETTWGFVPKDDEDYRQEMMTEDSEENIKLKEEIQHVWIQTMAQPDPDVKASYKEYHAALKTYQETYPRTGVWPKRMKTLSNGNKVSVDTTGSAPNVIG
jgi:hypothetical protein